MRKLNFYSSIMPRMQVFRCSQLMLIKRGKKIGIIRNIYATLAHKPQKLRGNCANTDTVCTSHWYIRMYWSRFLLS